jgi:PAS domain-containing protein
MQQLVLALVMVATSLAAAVVALLAMDSLVRWRAARAARLAAARPGAAEDAVLLFDDRQLVDASEAAQALMDSLPPGPSDWARFAGWAAPRFPGFAAQMSRLAEAGRVRLDAAGDPPLVLRADWRDGLARLSLLDPQAEGRTVPVERLSLAAAEQELAQLRRILDSVPVPVWRETDTAEVVWANRGYLDLVTASGGPDGGATAALGWPLPRLFDLSLPKSPRNASILAPAPDTPEDDGAEAPPAPRPEPRPGPPQRHVLDRPGLGGRRWFDCLALEEDGGGRIVFALPADTAARAEAALADLVQTLSRTFAHLPVGLAVFDRKRRLQLFNPALGELTTLSPEFLTARPGFEQFFDALRARQMIPEPKDYRAWRHGLTEIERAAASGHYQEVWSLTTGQTYRVTGRPHADGAVAFLIEDVSAEMSLTRRFRAEIETGQAVLDSLDEAIAVFSPAGILVMSNEAYSRTWGSEPETMLGEAGVTEALRLWKSMAHPSPHWADLRTLIGAGGPRRAWEGAIELRDGRHMLCRLAPLAGGATLVGFRPAAAGPAMPVPVVTDTGSDRGTDTGCALDADAGPAAGGARTAKAPGG